MAPPLRWRPLLLFLCLVGSGARERPTEGCEASKGGSLLQATAAQSRLLLNHSQADGRSLALHRRASRARGGAKGKERRREGNLDAAVASKAFDWVDDVVDAMVDVANTVADYGSQIGAELADVGLQAGSFAGNSALVIGKSVVTVAEQTYKAVPSEIKAAASTLGSEVLSAGALVVSVGEAAAKAASRLSQEGLQKAAKSLEQGVKLAGKVAQDVAAKAADLGAEVGKLGTLAVALAGDVWNVIKELVGCFLKIFSSMCTLFLEDACDCDAGSYLTLSTSKISARCVFKAGGFTQGFGLNASAGGHFGEADESSSGKPKLPGSSSVQDRRGPLQELKEKKSLRTSLAKAPEGSCSGHMQLAIDGLVQFEPAVELSVDTGGDTVVAVSGTVRVSVEALVEAEGSCAFLSERRFPKKPIKKVFCAKFFCVAVLLQMLAELEVAGTLTGSAELTASADFEVNSRTTVNPTGKAEVEVQGPEVRHRSAFGLAASASAVLRLGMGPVLTVWPMPGVPVTVNPMMNAELRGQATVEISGAALLQREQHEQLLQPAVRSPEHRHCTVYEMPLGSTPYGANVGTWEACLDLCRDTTGCEQVVYRDGYCYGMSESSDEDEDGLGGSNEHYTSAHCTSANTIEMCAAAALNLYTDVEIQGFALPKALEVSLDSTWLEDALEDAILKGAQAMVDKMIGAACIPGVNYVTGKIMDVAQGAVGLVKALIPDLSLDFSTPSMVLLAPKKLFCVEVAKTPGFDAAPCNAELGCSHAGRGTPQLAQKDVEMEAEPAELLQLAGDAAPTRTCSVYKKWRMRWLGSDVEMPLGSTPYGANVGTWEACLGLCQATEGCRQVVYAAGHCYGMSVASNEDQDGLGGHNDLFTSAHCIGAERHCDIFLNWRMVMVPGSGISLGNLPYGEFSGGWFRCLELCKETPACQQVTYTAEGRCFGMSARTHEDANGLGGSNSGFTTAHCYGEVSGPAVVMQSPGCPNVFMGDRFLDLGPWRLAAWDDNHLSIAHKTGQAAIVFRNDGVVLQQRTDLLAFSRPVAPPKGIKFGFQFIQIGEFRLGAVNDNHFSIQHSGGTTVQAFGSDGTVYSGPLEDFGTFDRPVMAAEGVNFGDGFLQIGRFRLVVMGSDLVLSHGTGSTNQVWKSDGTAQPASGSPHVLGALQPAPWTCKDLQELAYGACGAFGAFGDRFVELGNWRLAAIDATHLSISHKGGQTPQIYRADGVMIPGRHDYSAWHRPKGFPSGIVFGSRFIQIGNFRLGDADGHHFTISHENGITIQIFRSDGTLHPGPRHELNLWSRTAGPPQGITFGDRFLEIGLWRFADVDGEHFALTQAGGQTAQIFRSDNQLFPGPNAHWTGVFDRYPEYHCGSIHSVFGSCTGLVTGDRFIQLGDWRLADIDGNHFSLSCKTGQTSQVFHRDGTVLPGPRTDLGAWKREAKGLEAPGVTFGDRFLELGQWRLWAEGQQLVLSHQAGTSVKVYQSDGSSAGSPGASAASAFARPASEIGGVAFGDRFLQIGHFRLGDVDGAHFAISHPDGLSEVHHSDGTLLPSGTSSLTTLGRRLEECQPL